MKNIDKSNWARGDWDNEPDFLEWTDDSTSYPCMAIRTELTGSWCGYVGVSKDHPLFEKDYHDITDLEVHGGITYGNPLKGKEGYWFFGFDCAHFGDFCPIHPNLFLNGDYRNLSYVQKECASLAKQLKVLEKEK